MPAFMDATCPKCQSHIGWFGEVTDRPECGCGHQVERSVLESDQAKIDELRHLLVEIDELREEGKTEANKLRRMRLAAGLNLHQAAKLAGTAMVELSKIERGEIELTEEFGKLLGEIYGGEPPNKAEE